MKTELTYSQLVTKFLNSAIRSEKADQALAELSADYRDRIAMTRSATAYWHAV